MKAIENITGTAPGKLRHRRATLVAKLDELIRSPQNRDGLAIETTADLLDSLQLAADRDLAVESVNRNFEILRDVQNALDTIDSGDYGLCQECGDDIPSRRLDAIPWARYCVACQELHERDQNRFIDAWTQAA
jgi:DnaK suppressor protein